MGRPEPKHVCMYCRTPIMLIGEQWSEVARVGSGRLIRRLACFKAPSRTMVGVHKPLVKKKIVYDDWRD